MSSIQVSSLPTTLSGTLSARRLKHQDPEAMSLPQSNAGSKATPKQTKDDDDHEWRQLLKSTAEKFEGIRMTICSAAMNNFGKPLSLRAAPRKILKPRTARTIKAQQANITQGVANLSFTNEPLPVVKPIAKSCNEHTVPSRLFTLPQKIQDAITTGSSTPYAFQNNVYALERLAKRKLLKEADAPDGLSEVGVDNRPSTQTGRLYTGSRVSYP